MGDKKDYRVKTFTSELKVFHAMKQLAALDEQVNQFIAANKKIKFYNFLNKNKFE